MVIFFSSQKKGKRKENKKKGGKEKEKEKEHSVILQKNWEGVVELKKEKKCLISPLCGILGSKKILFFFGLFSFLLWRGRKGKKSKVLGSNLPPPHASSFAFSRVPQGFSFSSHTIFFFPFLIPSFLLSLLASTKVLLTIHSTCALLLFFPYSFCYFFSLPVQHFPPRHSRNPKRLFSS